MKNLHRIAPLLLVGMVFGGCSATAMGSGETYHVSVAENFDSLDELAMNADYIVRGVAGVSDEIIYEELPFTLTEVNDYQLLKGEVPGRIVIRQLGRAYDTFDSIAPVLQEGEEYILYLDAFEFYPNQPIPDEYVIVGFGSLQREGDSFVPPESGIKFGGLDSQISLTDVVNSITVESGQSSE